MKARLLLVLALCISSMSCSNDFYLTESETAAIQSLVRTDQLANALFDNLQTQQLNIQFTNSTPPRISSSNLASILNSTELGLVGIGTNVSATRISGELEKQLEAWIIGRLALYTGQNSAAVRLERLEGVRVTFINNPTFTYNNNSQSISFSVTVTVSIDGTIDVDALDSFTNFFFNVNGTYPLTVNVNPLVLNGQISLASIGSENGRLTFKLTPQPGTVAVLDRNGSSAPAIVKDSLRQLMARNLSAKVDERFDQQYTDFNLRTIQLSAANPTTLEIGYRHLPEVAHPLIHSVTRSADGKLYHARNGSNRWSSFNQINLPAINAARIEEDPTLVSSGADQLELAAVNRNGHLVYAHWRMETWINDTVRTPSQSTFRGKPAMIASAPGQVEVVVERNDGTLWHLRRLNGVWTTPAELPLRGLPFIVAPSRNPVAVQVGNKMVVVFTDAQNGLRAVAYQFETGTWSQPTFITTQETIQFAPAAAASADGRVDVVYVGQSGTPYHVALDVQAATTTSTGISYGPETNIGGVVNSTPSLSCSGYRVLELVGRGTDNKLYHNRFVPSEMAVGTFDGRTVLAGWQGWSTLNGNYFGSITLSGERMEEFSSVSMRDGRIQLVGRVRPTPVLDDSSNQYVFHNSFDSSRYGFFLWKTVKWRGYEKLSTQRFVGRPAIAAIEQSAEAGFVSLDLKLRYSRIGERNLPSFVGFPQSTPVGLGVDDPAIVSSGPGLIDLVWLTADGKPVHLRYRNQRFQTEQVLNVPSGVTLRSTPTVASYGNGHLDIVAASQNGSLYHWRFRNGAWSFNPTTLSGTAASAPALTYTGSGQLELLFVAGDFKMYRSRFINGSWATRQQLPSTFTINTSYFTPVATSSWGDGTVDVLVVNRTNGAVYHRRIGRVDESTTVQVPGQPPPRVFNNIGGVVTRTPVLSAFGPTDFNIVAVGTDNVVYGNRSRIDPTWGSGYTVAGPDPTMLWSGFRGIGGRDLVLGGVANNGPKNLVAIGLDQSGVVFVNRYNGITWSDYQPLVGPTAQTGFSPPQFKPAIVSSGN